jgi:hypothetical protein
MPTLSITRRCLHAFVLASVAAGCSATLESASIVPTKFTLERQHPEAVTLEATGQEDPWIGFAVISTETWHTALEQAVEDSGLFAEVSKDADAPFILRANLKKLEEPESGISMRAYLTVDWSLRRRGSEDVLWEQSISTTGRARPNDEEDMHARGQVAIERAAKQNIERGLERLSRLEL